MLKNIITAFLLTISLHAHAESVALASHGSLEIDVPKGWKLEKSEIPHVGYNLALSPLSEANAKCLITVMYPPRTIPVDKQKIKEQLSMACQRYISGSVEQKMNIKEYSLSAGYGVYATFTDADL